MSDVYHLADEGVGYLDMREFNKARWAWEQSHPASEFMQWLQVAGHVSFADEDVRVTGSSDPSIPIPATKLAWEEITRLATEIYNQYGDLEPAAGDHHGAELIELLIREVQTAWYRWPIEEKPHKVTAMPCPGCNMLTLMYKPPREHGDGVLVDCVAECGHEMSGEQFSDMLDLIEQETMGTKKVAKRWVTVEDAAKLAGKAKNTIWRWAREERVRTQHYRGVKYYNLADVYEVETQTRERA